MANYSPRLLKPFIMEKFYLVHEGRSKKAEGRGATAVDGFPGIEQVAWQKAQTP
jgi:hypothetical protein